MTTTRRTKSTIIHEQEDPELIIVENDGIQILAGCEEGGRVLADHVRIIDTRNRDEELAYWTMTEWKEEDDSKDSATAMNAILSAIELVFTGQYRKQMKKRRGA